MAKPQRIASAIIGFSDIQFIASGKSRELSRVVDDIAFQYHEGSEAAGGCDVSSSQPIELASHDNESTSPTVREYPINNHQVSKRRIIREKVRLSLLWGFIYTSQDMDKFALYYFIYEGFGCNSLLGTYGNFFMVSLHIILQQSLAHVNNQTRIHTHTSPPALHMHTRTHMQHRTRARTHPSTPLKPHNH